MVTDAVTDEPAEIAASRYAAPPSSEYCNFATATSSVADNVSVTGVRCQLPLPSALGARVAALMTGGVASAIRSIDAVSEAEQTSATAGATNRRQSGARRCMGVSCA